MGRRIRALAIAEPTDEVLSRMEQEGPMEELSFADWDSFVLGITSEEAWGYLDGEVLE